MKTEILPFSNDFIAQINFNNRIEYIADGRTFDYPTTVKKMKMQKVVTNKKLNIWILFA